MADSMAVRRLIILATTMMTALAVTGAAAEAGSSAPRVGPVIEISRGCLGLNAETELAVDGRYIYATWIGCGGIGFARSTDGGRSFGKPVLVPESAGTGSYPNGIPKGGWDPSVAVAPNHTVYVGYMLYHHSQISPNIAISTDRGATFARVSRLFPPVKNNWGDRDFIAESAKGVIYVTWDFGPSIAVRHGNIVIQKSTDGGKTWSKITVVTPGYPDHGGGVAAPLALEPSGRIDLAFWLWSGGARPPYALPPNHIYFTSSTDGGRSWTKPVAIRPEVGRIGYWTGWIDVALALDAAGNLYATWDTQSPGGDIGWLSFSTDHGRTWAPARRATLDHDSAEHIMAVAAGPPGVAYVGWLYYSLKGYVRQYLRVFSLHTGWLGGPVRISRPSGGQIAWAGDTIGIARLPGNQLELSWTGAAVPFPDSAIFAASVQPW